MEPRPPTRSGSRRPDQRARGLSRPDRGRRRRQFGSIWALRDRGHGEPDTTETRLLSAAADQIGQALAHDRLAAESQAAEIARQSDALKSALLQSVSHDLRTPLATIRAAAGTLRPGSGLSADDQQESADAIDREVEYLNRLVTNLLDLSRIEAGALRAERDVYELDDLVGQTVERLRERLGDRPLEVDLAAPPVEVDPVFLDEALTNAIENAIKYTPPGTAIRIAAERLPGEPRVRLTVEDAGPGVPDEALPKDLRQVLPGPGVAGGSRSGTGIGLAVVRGLVEAMGGRGSRRAAASSAGSRSTSTCRWRPFRWRPPSRRVDDAAQVGAGRADRPRRRGRRRDAGGADRELTTRGYRVEEAGDGREALLRWETRRPGRRPARPRPARHRRPRHRPPDPPRGHDADRHPVRPVRGAREGRGARARRRRLRHQAVRGRRAQRPPPGRAPARRRPRRRPGRADRRRTARVRCRPARGPRRRRTGRPDAPRVRDPAGPARQRRAASSRRAGCCGPSGARRTPARTATSTSTSASSGASSPPPTPGGRLRDLIVTEPGVGYRVRELDRAATLGQL